MPPNLLSHAPCEDYTVSVSHHIDPPSDPALAAVYPKALR
jgi:hypothetical protein